MSKIERLKSIERMINTSIMYLEGVEEQELIDNEEWNTRLSKMHYALVGILTDIDDILFYEEN